MLPHSRGIFLMLAHSKNQEEKDMEELENKLKNKGGRPVKAIKKSRVLTLKCSNYERMIIQAKAKKVNLTLSEYLREMALSGKVSLQGKALPKEVLEMTGTLNHMAANLNQLAKKSNSVTEVLTKTDFLVMKWLSDELRGIAIKLKNSLS
jgi:Mobilization protein NikA